VGETYVRKLRPVHMAARMKGDRATPRDKIEGANASIEAAGAAIIIGALTWVLGDAAEPTIRVKIYD
jgi:hypothetical protein